MFGKKMRHVGDRVAAVVAESEEIALEALKLIDVEYEVLKPVMSIDEAMAEDAPVVHDERWCMLLVRQILWKMITAMQPSAASI